MQTYMEETTSSRDSREDGQAASLTVDETLQPQSGLDWTAGRDMGLFVGSQHAQPDSELVALSPSPKERQEAALAMLSKQVLRVGAWTP